LFNGGPVLGVTTDGQAMRAQLDGDFQAMPPAPARALQPQPVPAYDGVTTVAEVPALPAGPFGVLVRAADGTAVIERSRYLGPLQAWTPDLEGSGLRDVVRVGIASGAAAGVGYFALTTAGNLFAWGSNEAGMLGLGQTQLQLPIQPTPALVRFPPGVSVMSVTGRLLGGFALDATGRVWEWGQAGLFEALNPAGSASPERVAALEPFGAIRQIECAAFRACAALTSGGDLLAWGYASTGAPSRPIVWPIGVNRVATPAGRKAVYVGTSGLVVYALLDDGSLALVTSTPAAPLISRPFVPRSSGSTCASPLPPPGGESARPGSALSRR
jgi:hypothetical protein